MENWGPWGRDVTLHLTKEKEKRETRERDLSVGLVGLGWAGPTGNKRSMWVLRGKLP